MHLCVSIPPKQAVSEFVGYLKGKSALMIFDKHPEQATKWDRKFWARGYYVTTIGDITEEAIKNYIKEQQEVVVKNEETKNSPYIYRASGKPLEVVVVTLLKKFFRIFPPFF